ncbi:hypothetical protein M5689_000060 [Euphorbia peplus]|nr:hypothetical protein M5689_000060 [Euphorbia peplus]
MLSNRISFSNDFADSQEIISKFESSYREAPVSTDFEFSVRNYNMSPADEIFCKGKILPLKDESSNQLRKMTLRDELMAEDEDDEFDPFGRVHKSSGWFWKERLGLRKGNMVNKNNNNGGLERIVEEKRSVFLQHDQGFAAKNIGIVD